MRTYIRNEHGIFAYSTLLFHFLSKEEFFFKIEIIPFFNETNENCLNTIESDLKFLLLKLYDELIPFFFRSHIETK